MLALSAFIEGLVILLAMLACVLATAWFVMRGRVTGLDGHLWLLAYAVVATAVLLAVHIVPGALGVLNRFTVLGASVIALLAAIRLRAHSSEGTRRRARQRADRIAAPLATSSRHGYESPWSWTFALAATGLVAGVSLHYVTSSFGTAPGSLDALAFHLPGAARWIQTGTFWEINQFIPALAHGDYPNNGDVVFLALMLPFKSALLVRAAMIPYLALTGIAVYAVARELDAPRPASVLFAAAFCSMPAVIAPALADTEVDMLMLFGFSTGIAFLLRHRRSRAATDLVLAGVALGISFGTKWYAVPAVAVVVVLWALGSASARQPPGRIARDGLRLTALIAAAGGFWLIRNLVESANPVFPLRVAPFGLTIFDAPPDVVRERGGFTVSHYFGSPHVISTYILPALRDWVGWVGVLFAAAVLAAAVIAARDRRRRAARTHAPVLLMVAAALLLAIVYTVTPDTALGPRNMPVLAGPNSRYLMPALVVAAPLAAWCCGRLGRLHLAIEVAGLGLAVQALSRAFSVHSGVVIATTLLVLIGGMLWLRPPRPLGTAQLRPWLRPLRVGILATLLALGGAVVARHRFDDVSYARSDATLGWIAEHAASGHSVGLAGLWTDNGLSPVFPAFGPTLGNRVTYVGPFVQHMLQQYATPASFERAVQSGRYDLLIVGRGFPYPLPHVPDEAPLVAAGYHEVASSNRLLLFAR